MNSITKTIVATVATLGIALGGAAAANAEEDYVSPKAVPGHAKQAKQGKVVTHWTAVEGDCLLVANTLGDFGGDPYLNDGQMMNRYICEDGSVATYHIFHESHPAYDADKLTPIWGSWGYFVTTNSKG